MGGARAHIPSVATRATRTGADPLPASRGRGFACLARSRPPARLTLDMIFAVLGRST